MAIWLWFPGFGQEDENRNVQAFLPEITKTFSNVRDLAIHPDGKEVLFTAESPKKEFSVIISMKKKGKKFKKLKVVPFSGQYRDVEPAFSPDGQRLYFASNRPLVEGGPPKDYDIWFVEKDGSGAWTEAQRLPAPVNSKANEFYPSLSSNGNLYFTAQREGSLGKEDIFLAEFEDGIYKDPLTLGKQINSELYEFNAYVAPDESFLIFTSYGRADDLGGGDLYINFKTSDGNWGQSIHMGKEVNSPALDYCPFVDFNTGRFYFTSNRSALKKNYAEKLDLKSFLKEGLQFQNGSGRIYFTKFDWNKKR